LRFFKVFKEKIKSYPTAKKRIKTIFQIKFIAVKKKIMLSASHTANLIATIICIFKSKVMGFWKVKIKCTNLNTEQGLTNADFRFFK
tara:strand:- start:4833 stop:5093 length:261 start_codon:yes stop_codon:yes gene_type:complete